MGSSSLTRDQTWGPLHWEHGVLATGPPVSHLGGKSETLHFPVKELCSLTYLWREHFLFFKKLFIYLTWRLIALQHCSGFCHILTWIFHGCTRVLHPEHPSHLPPHPIHLGHPSAAAKRAPCIMHQTWTGNLFHIWYFTCFNAILLYHPTLALSHRVQKTVQYICVSFAVSHTGLLLLSF